MMHGREKSDSVIVAVKSPNKTGEPGSGGDGAKGGRTPPDVDRDLPCREKARDHALA